MTHLCSNSSMLKSNADWVFLTRKVRRILKALLWCKVTIIWIWIQWAFLNSHKSFFVCLRLIPTFRAYRRCSLWTKKKDILPLALTVHNPSDLADWLVRNTCKLPVSGRSRIFSMSIERVMCRLRNWRFIGMSFSRNTCYLFPKNCPTQNKAFTPAERTFPLRPSVGIPKLFRLVHTSRIKFQIERIRYRPRNLYTLLRRTHISVHQICETYIVVLSRRVRICSNA